MKQFLKEILKQITGNSFRYGKFSMTWFAVVQMNEHGLHLDTIEDVLKNGREVKSLVQNYGEYTVSISYKWDLKENRYMITSVRKYWNEKKGYK